jgi:hypothetical protein
MADEPYIVDSGDDTTKDFLLLCHRARVGARKAGRGQQFVEELQKLFEKYRLPVVDRPENLDIPPVRPPPHDPLMEGICQEHP